VQHQSTKCKNHVFFLRNVYFFDPVEIDELPSFAANFMSVIKRVTFNRQKERLSIEIAGPATSNFIALDYSKGK